MKKPNGKKLAAAWLLMGSSAALAQNQPHAPAPADPNPVDRPAPTELLASNNGSLFAAAQAARGVDPKRARSENVGFFAVPKPEAKILRKHDLVTIIIREESVYSSDGTTDTKKEAALEASVEEWVKFNFKNFSLEGGAQGDNPPSVKVKGNRNFKGEATVDRTDSFIARIQAEVVDVKPNGTFVLQARKKIKTDEEEQEFVLSGIAQAKDVTPDNSVLSTQIFNLELQKNHKGTVRDNTRKGVIPRLIDFVNPF